MADDDPSATQEAAVARGPGERRRAAWLADNGEANRTYNDDVEKRGVFSDGIRRF